MNRADLDTQFRALRTQAFAATFERVVWLDAGLLAAIFYAARTEDPPLATAYARGLLLTAVWLLAISLTITLCIPMYRAIINVMHMQQGEYRVAWGTYALQLLAAALTGLAVILLVLVYSALL